MPDTTTTRKICLTVNGVVREGLVEPRATLADFLRQDLELTGTHIGCEHGVCGVCTILVDGRAVRSCLMLALQADGAKLMTVEGLSEPGDKLHPIQEAFLEEHGLQCGYCPPGFLIAVYELLENNPSPSEEQILDVLGGQICRCTGYQSILRAVHSAAAKLGAARPTASDGRA